MEASKKKIFQVKVRSLRRTYKEYSNYRHEVDSYDMDAVSQDKKKEEFFKESQSALQHVAKNLAEYCLALNSYIEENKADIEQDDSVKDEYEEGKQTIAQVKALLPAMC